MGLANMLDAEMLTADPLAVISAFREVCEAVLLFVIMT